MILVAMLVKKTKNKKKHNFILEYLFVLVCFRFRSSGGYSMHTSELREKSFFPREHLARFRHPRCEFQNRFLQYFFSNKSNFWIEHIQTDLLIKRLVMECTSR